MPYEIRIWSALSKSNLVENSYSSLNSFQYIRKPSILIADEFQDLTISSQGGPGEIGSVALGRG